jgi:hypothetical protein
MAASTNNPLIAAANKAAAEALTSVARGTPALPAKQPTAATEDKKTVQEAKKENVTSSGGESNGGVAISVKSKRLHNPLSQYSSSTYKLSLYMISPETANAYTETGLWDLKSMTLIAQSGGITKGVDAIRSPYFDLDLFIDNLTITTVIDNGELGVATTSYDFRFQILEPYSISFPTNLIKAALHVQETSNVKRNITQPLDALSMQYMLAIHFYGYDSEGKITSGTAVDASSSTGVASGGAYQRLFPIIFTKMTSRLDNRTATYDIEAKLYNHQVAYSKTRGAVPDSTTISASTVKEALDGFANSLNKKQKLISGDGDSFAQQIPDEYEFIFDKNSDIASATIADKNHFVVGNTPMPEVLGSLNINVRLSESGRADIVSKQKRQLQFAVGTPFMSVVDQVITQSSYLTRVLKAIDKEQVEAVHRTDKGFVTNSNPKPLAWYHVTPQLHIKGWDKKRNQYAYKMTYKIQPKEIPYIRATAVTKTSEYPGAYKQYDYWYTGQNAEILSYEQTYNLLYFVEGAAASEYANTENIDTSAPRVRMASSSASGTGRLPGTNAAVDNIRSSLYSPGDQLHARIEILGDPDFIMTSEAGVETPDVNRFYGNDYTINPAAGQVFIEIGFNQVRDYNTDIGLLEHNNDIFFWNYSEEVKEKSGNRMIYMLLKVKSKFNKGVFKQELNTKLPPFAKEGATSNSTADQRAESKKSASAGSAGGSGAGSAAFAAVDPRRSDLKPATAVHSNQLPVLAPATGTDGENEARFAGAQNAATIFTRDSNQRDSVTLLPKRN